MKSEGYNTTEEEITFYMAIEGEELIKPRSACAKYNSPLKLLLDNINIDGLILNRIIRIILGKV